jgi:hypothetical protein
VETGTHEPVASVGQRTHARAYATFAGLGSAQVPGAEDRIEPTRGLPLTLGGVMFTGGAAATGAVASEGLVLEPSASVAVTSDRMLAPMSGVLRT